MEKAIIDTLKATNSSNERIIVYPRTVFEAVSNIDGVGLDEVLRDFQNNINNNVNEIINIKKTLAVLESLIQDFYSGNNVTYVCDDKIYSERVEQGASCLHPTTFTPYKEGWNFIGWREDTEASGQVLADKVMDGQPITLYAVFGHTIYISYNSNGGDDNNIVNTDKIIQFYNSKGNYSNAEFTLASSNLFTKTGCTFSKWAMNDVNGTKYNAGEKVLITTDTIFYAIWDENVVNYLIQNGVSSYNVESSTHKATTDMSQALTYTVNNNGQKVIFENGSPNLDADIYIKFPVTTSSYLSKTLNMSGNLKCNTINEGSGLACCAVYLAVFDESDNIIKELQVADCYANPEYNKTNQTFTNSSMQLPSDGNYYVGYKIRVGGAYSNEFELNISELFIQ